MDEKVARRRLAKGIKELKEGQPKRQRQRDYLDGNHDKPFTPPGVSQEYIALRDISVANMLPLAVNAPIQRLRVDGYMRHGAGDDDSETQDLLFWRDTWQHNRMDARQRIVHTDAFVHGRGIVSVTASKNNAKRPRILIESPNRVHIEMDPEDPFKPLYAVKHIVDTSETAASPTDKRIILTDGSVYAGESKEIGYVYDAKSWAKFERTGPGREWVLKAASNHTLGDCPFVPYDVELDSEGHPHSLLDPLIPAQDAINFVRFATLLALQFSAHRQRAVTGFDPVIKTEGDQIVYQKDKNGVELVDPLTGMKIPMLQSLGRMGVDRLLTFANADVKIWDMPESNLGNYIEVYNSLVQDLFARGQIPPQYQLVNLHNLTGDALTGAESTLTSLTNSLKTNFAESHEQVLRLAGRARGDQVDDIASEVLWGDGESRSFGQVIDAITKLISTGFPREAAYQMIPGATPQKVAKWMTQREKELYQTWQMMEDAGPEPEGSDIEQAA